MADYCCPGDAAIVRRARNDRWLGYLYLAFAFLAAAAATIVFPRDLPFSAVVGAMGVAGAFLFCRIAAKQFEGFSVFLYRTKDGKEHYHFEMPTSDHAREWFLEIPLYGRKEGRVLSWSRGAPNDILHVSSSLTVRGSWLNVTLELRSGKTRWVIGGPLNQMHHSLLHVANSPTAFSLARVGYNENAEEAVRYLGETLGAVSAVAGDRGISDSLYGKALAVFTGACFKLLEHEGLVPKETLEEWRGNDEKVPKKRIEELRSLLPKTSSPPPRTGTARKRSHRA